MSSQTLDGSVKLEIPVEFASHKSVVLSEHSPWLDTAAQRDRKATSLSISVTALPPLLLHIVLPPSYPLHSPPEIKSVRATNVWLPETKPLQAALIEMWQEGEPTLYNWVELIRTGEFLHTLGIISPANSDIIACVISKSRVSLNNLICVLLEDSRTRHRVLLHPC